MPLTPKNRKEEWLQGLVDHETTLTPKNRPEEWMKEIIDANGSGGGGTGGGVLIVHDNEGTLDKTFSEIETALKSGTLVSIAFNEVVESAEDTVCSPVSLASAKESGYYVYCIAIDTGETPIRLEAWKYTATTKNDYPVFTD